MVYLYCDSQSVDKTSSADPHKFLRNDRISGTISLNEGPNFFASAVADGMGGHNAGDVASQRIVESIPKVVEDYLNGEWNFNDASEYLEAWIEELNESLLEESQQDPEKEGMGTTLIASFIDFESEEMVFLNIGDSRLYRFRGGFLKQLSDDHSPGSNLGSDQSSHQLTNSLGVDRDIFADIKVLDSLEEDDMYLLCSDGLSDLVPLDEIENILSSSDNLKQKCDHLFTKAQENGGNDNISIIFFTAE